MKSITQTKHTQRSGLATAAFFGFALAASAVSAQTTIDEPFDSPLGGIPADWTGTNDTFGVDPIIVDNTNEVADGVTDIGPSDGTWLQFHRDTSDTASDNPRLPIFYTGGLVQDVTSGSVTMRWGDATPDALTQAQVFLRAEGTTSQNPAEGYNITMARFRQEGSNENVFRLGIGKQGTSGNAMVKDADAIGAGWADLGLANFNTNENYQLDFSIVGNNIAAKVFAEDGTSLGSTSATDSAFQAAGNFGLKVLPSNSDSDLYVRDLTVIPEPSAYALFGGLAALGLAAARRRQTRR